MEDQTIGYGTFQPYMTMEDRNSHNTFCPIRNDFYSTLCLCWEHERADRDAMVELQQNEK